MDQSFAITPTNQKISLEAGTTYTGSISVINPADSTNDLSYLAEITPYSVIGEEYDADLATRTDHSQIIDWITIDNPTGTVAPNNQAEINFTITVPDDAPAGGQYATIAVRNFNENNAEGVSINNIFEIASVIYADVAGETIHSGEIIDNYIPGFSFVTPISTSATLSNTGNIHQNAIISLKVTNIFTGEVIYPKSDQVQSFNEIIMPDTTRLATRQIDNLPSLGVVHISQEISYNEQNSLTEKDVFLCPIWFLVLAFFAIFMIIFLIVHNIRKHRLNKTL